MVEVCVAEVSCAVDDIEVWVVVGVYCFGEDGSGVACDGDGDASGVDFFSDLFPAGVWVDRGDDDIVAVVELCAVELGECHVGLGFAGGDHCDDDDFACGV